MEGRGVGGREKSVESEGGKGVGGREREKIMKGRRRVRLEGIKREEGRDAKKYALCMGEWEYEGSDRRWKNPHHQLCLLL